MADKLIVCVYILICSLALRFIPINNTESAPIIHLEETLLY